MEELTFEQTDRSVVLVKSNSAASHLTIPDTWQGKPVREIGRYAFANHAQLRRITLPSELVCINNHAFFNCSQLSHVALRSNGLHSVGDGAFKNCRALHHISVRGLTYLKSIVTDFSNAVILTTVTTDGQTVVLLFPEYDYTFQEIIPPREFRSVTYGSGSFYRMCVTRSGIDFAEYDRTFPRAVREDEPSVAREIALYRLQYPYQLRSTYREHYRSYLREHAAETVSAVLASRDIPRLELLLREDILAQSELDAAISEGAALDFPEGVSLLMDHRLSHFGSARRRFVL